LETPLKNGAGGIVATHPIDSNPYAICVVDLVFIIPTLQAAKRIKDEGLKNTAGNGACPRHNIACNGSCCRG
jgi:hypothetical protein